MKYYSVPYLYSICTSVAKHSFASVSKLHIFINLLQRFKQTAFLPSNEVHLLNKVILPAFWVSLTFSNSHTNSRPEILPFFQFSSPEILSLLSEIICRSSNE